jgi:hypothetical protein
MPAETEALIIVTIPSIFSVLLVYAEMTKKRWAWYCLMPVIILADCLFLLLVCRLWILIFSREFLNVPAFPGLQVFFFTVLMISLLGGVTLWLWRQRPKWNL